MTNNSHQRLTNLLLAVLCFIPLLVYCYFPKEYASPKMYKWLGFFCAFSGIAVCYFLQRRVAEPFERLKRDSVLNGVSQSPDAILIRVCYVAGFAGLRLNLFWIAIFFLDRLIGCCPD